MTLSVTPAWELLFATDGRWHLVAPDGSSTATYGSPGALTHCMAARRAAFARWQKRTGGKRTLAPPNPLHRVFITITSHPWTHGTRVR